MWGFHSSGLWCNSSISACEADGPGANPGFLTIPAGLADAAAALSPTSTARLLMGLKKLREGFEDVPDCGYPFGHLIWNGEVKPFFQRHHDFHVFQRIGPKVFPKPGAGSQLSLRNSELFDEDVENRFCVFFR